MHPCRAAIDKVLDPPGPANVALSGEDNAHSAEYSDQDAEDDQEASREGDTLEALISSQHLRPDATGPEEMPLLRWVLITSFILTTTFTIALLVDDLSIILGFVGSLGSTTISFILPGILYSSLHDKDDRFRRPAQFLAGWGFFVLVVALTANVVKLIHTGVAVGAEAKADRLAVLMDRFR